MEIVGGSRDLKELKNNATKLKDVTVAGEEDTRSERGGKDLRGGCCFVLVGGVGGGWGGVFKRRPFKLQQ